MLNYLRAEFYKVFHRKYTWITLLVLLALEAVLVWGFGFINANGSHIDVAEAAYSLWLLMYMGCFLTLFTCEMVFANQYKNGTLKNEVAFGLSRSRIYFGKYLTQLIVSILFCAVMVLFYLGTSYLFLYRDAAEDAVLWTNTAYYLLVCLAVWIGAQALSCACSFVCRGSTSAELIAIAVLFILPEVLSMVGFVLSRQPGPGVQAAGKVCYQIYEYTPVIFLQTATTTTSAWDWGTVGRACMIGGFWLTVPTILGLFGFHKREIH